MLFSGCYPVIILYGDQDGNVTCGRQVEALRNCLGAADASPSPCSSVSEGLDLFPDSPLHGFQLSPDFRPRASSNASSCGRLSPIPAVEPDWSPYYADQLAGSLEQNMKLDIYSVSASPRRTPLCWWDIVTEVCIV